jgi:hypothetical protein
MNLRIALISSYSFSGFVYRKMDYSVRLAARRNFLVRGNRMSSSLGSWLSEGVERIDKTSIHGYV